MESKVFWEKSLIKYSLTAFFFFFPYSFKSYIPQDHKNMAWFGKVLKKYYSKYQFAICGHIRFKFPIKNTLKSYSALEINQNVYFILPALSPEFNQKIDFCLLTEINTLQTLKSESLLTKQFSSCIVESVIPIRSWLCRLHL